MIKIRLSRYGTKNNQFYRIVAINQRSKTQGKFLEILGTYNPKKFQINIDKDKVQSWINKGAKISESVSYLLKGEKKPKNSKNEKDKKQKNDQINEKQN
ncbi:MAG: 30S ribosomal protein S16 [Patescibacteria group bacterium]|nr:30S ribosomal protein S16 [Patescibacteria group bacterium]